MRCRPGSSEHSRRKEPDRHRERCGERDPECDSSDRSRLVLLTVEETDPAREERCDHQHRADKGERIRPAQGCARNFAYTIRLEGAPPAKGTDADAKEDPDGG